MASHFQAGRLVIFGLRAEDVPTAVHFYQDVIGLRLLPHHDHPPAFDLGGGTYLAIVKGPPAPEQEAGEPPFPVVTFAVEDLDRAVQHLQAHNVELSADVVAGKQERWVMFRDPAGNLVEFVQFDGPLQG
jgi:catechol 2,3-dioxygenase-like lactoylglutathione lyase family enzyme